MSAPLTGALQSSALFNSMATDLLDDTNQAILKVSTAYQHSSLEQDGLSSGELDTDIGAVTFQLNLIEEASKKTGLQVSYGHYSADNSSEVASSGDSYEIAAFQTGNIFDKGRYQAFLVYGQTDYDNTRNVIINAAGTNRETLKSEGDISWYGVRSEISYPIQENINLIGQIGLLEYSADSVQETGVATLNGTPTASIAALRADDADFISVPFKFAVGYDLAFDKEAEKHSAFTLETGVIGNLNNTEDLRLTSTNTGNSFDLSVNQSSTVAGLVALKLNEFEIGEGFNLSGITQVEMGSDITTLRAGINITKRW